MDSCLKCSCSPSMKSNFIIIFFNFNFVFSQASQNPSTSSRLSHLWSPTTCMKWYVMGVTGPHAQTPFLPTGCSQEILGRKLYSFSHEVSVRLCFWGHDYWDFWMGLLLLQYQYNNCSACGNRQILSQSNQPLSLKSAKVGFSQFIELVQNNVFCLF